MPPVMPLATNQANAGLSLPLPHLQTYRINGFAISNQQTMTALSINSARRPDAPVGFITCLPDLILKQGCAVNMLSTTLHPLVGNALSPSQTLVMKV